MSRTKFLLYNSVFQAISQIVVLLAGLIIPTVLLHTYGSEVNGLVISITQFISYFSLVEAGISASVVYSLYKPIADRDILAISEIASAAKKFYRNSGIIFIILVVLFAIVYPVYFKLPSLSYFEIVLLIIVLGIGTALELFAQGQYKVLLTAGQCMYAISITNIVYYFLYVTIVVMCSKMGVSILVLRLIAIFALISRPILLSAFCRSKFPSVNYNAKPNLSSMNKRWDALFLQVLGVIQSGSPIIILTILAKDLKMVSVFSVYNMVVIGVGSIAGIFTSGLSASFGDVISRGEKSILQRAYSEFEFVYYCLITILYSVTVVIILPFIRLYTFGVTDTEYILPLVSVLITLQGFLNNIKTPQAMLVISAGLYKETRLQSTAQASLVVIVGCLLTPFLGVYGILIGLLCSETYRMIDLMLFIPKTVTGLNWKITARRVVIMLMIFVLSVGASRLWPISCLGYLNWVMFASVVFITEFVVVLSIAYLFDRNELYESVKRIAGVVRRKK